MVDNINYAPIEVQLYRYTALHTPLSSRVPCNLPATRITCDLCPYREVNFAILCTGQGLSYSTVRQCDYHTGKKMNI